MTNIFNLITKKNIILLMKIILIYSLLLIIFHILQNKNTRFIFTSIIYLLCIYLFNIECKLSFLYVIIALCCVITESIYINFFNETWIYSNPDIISIPYWLISIWSIAILLIIEGVNMIKT